MPVCTVNSQTVEVREGDRVGKISQTYLITDILRGEEKNVTGALETLPSAI